MVWHVYDVNCRCGAYTVARRTQNEWIKKPLCPECDGRLGLNGWVYLGTVKASTQGAAVKKGGSRKHPVSLPHDNEDASIKVKTHKDIKDLGMYMRYFGCLQLLADSAVHLDEEDFRERIAMALDDAHRKHPWLKWRRILNRFVIEMKDEGE